VKRFMLLGAVLFVAILSIPVAVSASTTASTTISSVVSSVITLSTSGTVNINTTPAGAGVQTISNDVATVSTNDTAGYTLQLGETSATTTLTNGGNTIAASSGTQTTPVVETAGTWGYRVDGLGGFGAGPTSGASNAAISGTIKFAGVAATGSPNTIKTTATTATSDTLSIWYGVAVNTSQATGTYTNSVTYTATAN
jgi:hypothetical protein